MISSLSSKLGDGQFTMSVNHLYHLDKNLKDCYQYDFDWSLLPDSLRKMCSLFAKALKQRDTSILFGLIVLSSFCMGHACVNVQNAFWKEPVIIWIASVITTGRCKSAFHEFLSDILELVADRVEVHGVKAKQMVLPHCTWDKFGELLAESGGRSLGLFDELMSFFSTMNMYSSHKLQISDTREYQDFLQLFTGKAKTRETVTGNANFNIARTSFSFMGFTQPHAALPVIQDTSNNAKGFTSRILWYFPQPVFAKFEDTILTKEENDLAQELREKLVAWLADLYMHGESTFQILEQGKMKSVSVTRTEYCLTDEAIKEFKDIHDEWELDVCEKNPYDPLLGGIYSRGKSHVLRLSVPIELLLAEFEAIKESEDCNSQDIPDACSGETSDSDNLNIDVSCDSNNDNKDDNEDDNEETNSQVPMPLTHIGPQAILVAHALVNICLSQLCTLNDKTHVLNKTVSDDTTVAVQHDISEPEGMGKVFKAVLSAHGPIVSFTVLNVKGLFRRHHVDNLTNKRLMQRTVDEMTSLGLGEVKSFQIPGNNSKVHFFCKQEPPSPEAPELMGFVTKLSKIGMSLPSYIAAYEKNDEESARHNEEYANRQDGSQSNSPKKRLRMQ